MASTASPESSRMPLAAAPFWSTELGPDCCKGKKMGKHWWWKMPSPNEKEPRTQINGINVIKARTWTHSRTGRNPPLSRQSMWKEPPACWTWTNPTSPHWSPLSPHQPDFVKHSKMKNCLNSTQKPNTIKHIKEYQGAFASSRCHKRTMAHVTLLQSQDVEISVAGCPETACPWKLFARQRMGKLTDPGRKSSGDVKLLCAPRIGNKQYP